MKFTANETGGNFSETAYGSASLTTSSALLTTSSASLTTCSAFFAQYEFNLFYLQRGNKHYELTNHGSTSLTTFSTSLTTFSTSLTTSLGNVLTVITDKRLLSCMGDTVQSSFANIVSATDYSPFGAPLAGRTFSSEGYRFGFNSKEKDDETYGEGNAYDFGARIYDARKGSWLSVDPLFKKFPSQSVYNYVANNPLVYLDIDGNEKDQRIIIRTENGDKVIVTKVVDKDEVKMSIQHTSNGDALYSMNIHEDLILDVRKGKEGVYSETKFSIRNSGFSALSDQWQDMTGGHEAGEIKEFGFVNTGGSVGSDWVLGLSSAKNKENIDLSVLLSTAGKYGPESKGIFDKFEDVMGSLKIQKSNLGEVLGVLAKTIQRQYDILERGKEIGEVGKKILDKKPKDTICLAGCGGKYHGVSPNKIRNNKNDSIGTISEIK